MDLYRCLLGALAAPNGLVQLPLQHSPLDAQPLGACILCEPRRLRTPAYPGTFAALGESRTPSSVGAPLSWLSWIANPPDDLGDPEGDDSGVLMLPSPDHGPPSLGESAVGIGVACLVAADLLGPVPRVDIVPSAPVVGTPVPEAAVNEHGDSCARENDVGLAAQVGEGLHVDPVPHAHRMELPTDGKLWSGVLAALRAHASLYRLGRGERLAPAFGHVIDVTVQDGPWSPT